MAPTTPTHVVRACVVSGGVTTPYQVAGRGLPTVILCEDREIVDTLLKTASLERRVVAPDLPRRKGSAAVESSSRAWLVAFLEALGLEGAQLHVESSYADDARGVAMIYPELVASVELLAPRGQASR